MPSNPDLFGLNERDVKFDFDIRCKCGVGRGVVHYQTARHEPTQSLIEHDPKRHGNPHFRKTRLRMIRDLAIVATGDAPKHPLLDDHRYDKSEEFK